MKTKSVIESPLVNIERDVLFVSVPIVFGALMAFVTYKLFVVVSGWFFLAMVPSVLICFQALWYLLNPFAMVFKDRIEIRQSLFHYKHYYFIDVRDIELRDDNRIYITYTDGEVERLNLFGIRHSELQNFVKEITQRKPGKIDPEVKTEPAS